MPLCVYWYLLCNTFLMKLQNVHIGYMYMYIVWQSTKRAAIDSLFYTCNCCTTSNSRKYRRLGAIKLLGLATRFADVLIYISKQVRGEQSDRWSKPLEALMGKASTKLAHSGTWDLWCTRKSNIRQCSDARVKSAWKVIGRFLSKNRKLSLNAISVMWYQGAFKKMMSSSSFEA